MTIRISPHDRCKRFAEGLERLADEYDNLNPPLRRDDIEFFAAALNRYINAQSNQLSMDHALGLKRGRGAPKRRGKNFERAEQVFHLRLAGKSWLDVADEMNLDVRTLQRAYERHADDIVHDLAEKLATA